MKNVILVVLLLSLAWYGYAHYQRRAQLPVVDEAASSAPSPTENRFKCDGRIYCSQMTSCAEATYFLQNCPGTKMDGNNDGIPCEKQWCN
jgi:hypothetical protein